MSCISILQSSIKTLYKRGEYRVSVKFQFYKVRLKLDHNVGISFGGRFQFYKVRLKQDGLSCFVDVFQISILQSSIKTVKDFADVKAGELFQFYKVRLKPTVTRTGCSRPASFQFYKVRLKRPNK